MGRLLFFVPIAFLITYRKASLVRPSGISGRRVSARVVCGPAGCSGRGNSIFIGDDLPAAVTGRVPGTYMASVVRCTGGGIFNKAMGRKTCVLCCARACGSGPLVSNISLSCVRPFMARFFGARAFAGCGSTVSTGRPIVASMGDRVRDSTRGILYMKCGSGANTTVCVSPRLTYVCSIGTKCFLRSCGVMLANVGWLGGCRIGFWVFFCFSVIPG